MFSTAEPFHDIKKDSKHPFQLTDTRAALCGTNAETDKIESAEAAATSFMVVDKVTAILMAFFVANLSRGHIRMFPGSSPRESCQKISHEEATFSYILVLVFYCPFPEN